MTDHVSRPECAATSPGDARDLRNLLEAVADVLTLPFDTERYEQRLAERAGWVLTMVRGALDEDPTGIGWNADYLRSRFPLTQGVNDRADRGEGQ
ncbi:hypothetical protein ACFYM5_17625 [Streptomyces sp. NPDC006706]|uniref:hypothetical protein n=1 Tax=Streptomyces sp. NPDC006706 TaxID=3364761 RepID=UPI00369EC047